MSRFDPELLNEVHRLIENRCIRFVPPDVPCQ